MRLNSTGDHGKDFKQEAIIQFVTESPAGSETFFWTDLHNGMVTERSDTEFDIFADMGSQSVLPRCWQASNDSDCTSLVLSFSEKVEPALVVSLPPRQRFEESHGPLGFEVLLYKLNIKLAMRNNSKQFAELTV